MSSHSRYAYNSSRSMVPTMGNQRLSYSSQSMGFTRGTGSRLAAPPSLILSQAFPHQSSLEFQEIRIQEKNQIKGLNNQFASFIQKVCFLEQQNVQLDKKLKELQKKKSSSSDLDALFHEYCSRLKHKIDTLANVKISLNVNLEGANALVEDCKSRYEEEINLRTDKENEFVLIKKDCDDSELIKIGLEAKRDALLEEIEYLRQMFALELAELYEQIQGTNVIIEIDNSRKLDLSNIINDVRGQYETMLGKMKNEASMDIQMKLENVKKDAGNYTDELRIKKIDITEMGRHIGRMMSELELLKQQKGKLESDILEAEERGDMAVEEARKRVNQLLESLEKLKRDMMRQVKDYQDLMNIKLALDIEIATYKKLLEGEESRLGNPIHVVHESIRNISGGQFDLSAMGAMETGRMGGHSSKSIIIKTVESQDGRRLAEY